MQVLGTYDYQAPAKEQLKSMQLEELLEYQALLDFVTDFLEIGKPELCVDNLGAIQLELGGQLEGNFMIVKIV